MDDCQITEFVHVHQLVQLGEQPFLVGAGLPDVGAETPHLIVVVEKGMDNIGNDHSSLATNRWVSPVERVTYPGAKAADVDRHHVLDAAWMSHAAAGVATGVPGDNLTVRAFPVAGVRTQRGKRRPGSHRRRIRWAPNRRQASGCCSQLSSRPRAGPTFTGPRQRRRRRSDGCDRWSARRVGPASAAGLSAAEVPPPPDDLGDPLAFQYCDLMAQGKDLG
jgi:hypothetical protein